MAASTASGLRCLPKGQLMHLAMHLLQHLKKTSWSRMFGIKLKGQQMYMYIAHLVLCKGQSVFQVRSALLQSKIILWTHLHLLHWHRPASVHATLQPTTTLSDSYTTVETSVKIINIDIHFLPSGLLRVKISTKPFFKQVAFSVCR